MVITSTDNSRVVRASKLADKKYRDREGAYLIEGVRLVSDAIAHGADVTDVFVREDVTNVSFDNVTYVSDRVFAKLSDTVNSQGVVAVVRKRECECAPPSGNCLVLDGLQDPGNVGTLIRTAVACGFTDVYAADCADLYSPKVIRGAMSAHFCIRLHEMDLQRIFETLDGVQTVAADMRGENLFETQLSSPVALVLGNEGNGLSAYSRRRVIKTVSLPMANDFESLNVAVAGSVIMYRIFSQNK